MYFAPDYLPTAKCWHLKVQLFLLYLIYNNTKILAVLVMVHKDHTDELCRKCFCDKKAVYSCCRVILFEKILQFLSPRRIFNLQAHCGTASHNIWNSAVGICMLHVCTRCYPPRIIAGVAKLTHIQTHTQTFWSIRDENSPLKTTGVCDIYIESLISTEIWNCIHMNNKKRKRTRQRVPVVLQSIKTSRI